jgi:hypothetical protein
MTSITYRFLFTVELLHKFSASQACADFTIIPSAQTASVLKGHKMIVKQYDNKLFAGVQVDESGKTFILFEEGMRLTFLLQLNNPLFFNYTNLPFSNPSGKVYYFTNRNNNISNGKKFLSANVLPYDGSRTYSIGDIAINNTGTFFQAIRSSSAATPFDLSDTSHWVQIDNNRYMTETDSLQWLPQVSTYSFDTPQSAVTIMVLGYNTAANDYTILVLSKTINFTKPASSFELDLSSLPAGKYVLNINGAVQNIYLNDELNRTKVFAIIDISNEATLATGYQLLDNNSNLFSPDFSIYFLNRSTIWKYILASSPNGDIADNAGIYQFTISSPVSNTIFSTTPIPLNEKALDFTLTIGSQDFTPIACATPQRLTHQTIENEVYYCSEIFLNY